MTFWDALVARFEALEQTLNALDAATGDGDHGTTMLKGLRAAAAEPDDPARAFRRAAGGASGTLMGTLIAALHQARCGAPLDRALQAAADRIAQIGGAAPGDKTLLDALLPATGARTAQDAAKAAQAGEAATRLMAAKRGRARYVEGAGVGHVDAGAASVTALLTVLADWDVP